MAKTADPVQAARKAAIKREAKRNRERKQQANEARTLRHDTGPLERQIQRLESRQTSLDQDGQEELQRLQQEVADVKRIKEEYIRKHPDQRNFVRGYEEASSSSANVKAGPSSQDDKQKSSGASPHFQNSQSVATQTTARDPRWSIYYDAVFNPYGAPPPGMPYLQKPHAQLVQEGLVDVAKPPPLPEETADCNEYGSDDDSDDSSVDEDLKDIPMPSDPPPIRMFTGATSTTNETAPESQQDGMSRGRGGGGGGHPRGRGGRARGSGSTHHQSSRHGPSLAQGASARPTHGPAGLPPRPPVGLPVRPPPPMAKANTSQPQPPGPPPAVPDGVVISAEPQLRDFKKEATAFVPAAIRKKQQEEKARIKRGLPARVDAAPISNDMSGASSASYRDRPDLLKSVQAQLSSKDAAGHGQSGDKKDYDRFLEEIGDLL